jgi:hypothetical protein
MDIDRTQKTIKELFLGTCWEYLRDNFHKFSETNRIKIALTLAQKDLPQEMKGSYLVTQMKQIESSGSPINFNVGETPIGDVPDAST